jgi:anti-sigma factor (TIGR02949 family)
MKKTDKKKYDCKDIEKKVQAYLDNRLSAKEVLLLEDHLTYCLPCDKKIEFEKRLKEIIKLKASEKSYPAKLETELKKIIRGK